MDEKNKLTKRIKRYADLSTSAGMMALKFAGSKILSSEKSKTAVDITEILGDLKGPIMKIAQLLSTVPDLLPPHYARALSQLQSNAPSMGWNFVKRRMRSELGDNWQQKFKAFEKSPFAAASLGQVHKAEDKNKNLIACKLQYPDMESIVEADINQLKLIFSIYKKIDSSINTSNIIKEISFRVREELNYERERKNLTLYKNLLNNIENVYVPKVFKSISTKRLLSMQWLKGENLLEFKNKSHSIRKEIALNMFKAWYYPFYKCAVIHGDPHLGNYSVRKDRGINLLDFGCVRVFKPEFVKGVIDLYYAILENNEELAVSAYESWGFENISKKLIETLNIWARFLYSPLLENRVRKMQETNSTAYGAETAAKVHKELKKIGGVKPPREFVFMDRAAIGLGSVFLHLDAEINWYKIFHNMIDDFKVDEVREFQKKSLEKANINEIN
ncbi:MAG: AarF/ABC1/UbiB kinase family protein [Rickettsiales bacterium TMED254]|nr:ABC transporter ATP-binding protein [Rickettsiales bacterium]RPF76309.1 MAG: AarF/ABC1/UbiB kinase family protein [Rickettsiales bacterium TMED254]